MAIAIAAVAQLLAALHCSFRAATDPHRGELRVVTLNLPTCYYLGAQGPEGLEYDLASRFCPQLGVRLKIYAVPNEAAIRSELASGHADLRRRSSPHAAWWRVGRRGSPMRRSPSWWSTAAMSRSRATPCSSKPPGCRTGRQPAGAAARADEGDPGAAPRPGWRRPPAPRTRWRTWTPGRRAMRSSMPRAYSLRTSSLS